MPVVILNRDTQPQFMARISALRADTIPGWGSFTATKLLRHLNRAIEMSLGELEVDDQSTWFSRHIIRRVVFHWFTKWPKGLKAPEVFTPEPSESFERERELLLDAIERFLIAAEKEPSRTAINPVFGSQPLEYWRRIHGIHFSHHMRQFGV